MNHMRISTDTTYSDLASLILQARPRRTLDVPVGKGDLSRELLHAFAC